MFHSIFHVALEHEVVERVDRSRTHAHAHLFFSRLGIGQIVNRTWLSKFVESESTHSVTPCLEVEASSCYPVPST